MIRHRVLLRLLAWCFRLPRLLLLGISAVVLVLLVAVAEQYYLEKNLEARKKELERETELEAVAAPVKAKSKMSKVRAHERFAAFQPALLCAASGAGTLTSKVALVWSKLRTCSAERAPC